MRCKYPCGSVRNQTYLRTLPPLLRQFCSPAHAASEGGGDPGPAAADQHRANRLGVAPTTLGAGVGAQTLMIEYHSSVNNTASPCQVAAAAAVTAVPMPLPASDPLPTISHTNGIAPAAGLQVWVSGAGGSRLETWFRRITLWLVSVVHQLDSNFDSPKFMMSLPWRQAC